MPIERSDAEIFGAHADAIRHDFRKVIPATITAVNGQNVDVQIAINSVLFDEINTAISVPAASLTGVPYCSLRAGGFSIWIPPTVGDPVLLIFSDLSCDTWQATNRADPPVDPGWKGLHTADSPFAIPLIAPATAPLTTAPAANMVLGRDGSNEQIVISGSDIKIGAGSVSFIALATKVDAIMALLKTLATAYTPVATAMAAIMASPGPVVALGTEGALWTTSGTAATALTSGIASVAATLAKAQ